MARVRPTLAHLGQLTHLGAVGAGQATKLVNQTLVLTNYCLMAEALRLAEAYGVDAAKVPAALAPGHAGSNLLPVMFERMIARTSRPAATCGRSSRTWRCCTRLQAPASSPCR